MRPKLARMPRRGANRVMHRTPGRLRRPGATLWHASGVQLLALWSTVVDARRWCLRSQFIVLRSNFSIFGLT